MTLIMKTKINGTKKGSGRQKNVNSWLQITASILFINLTRVSGVYAHEFTCLSCDDVVLPQDCKTISRCGQYGVCYTEQWITPLGYIRYNLGCKDINQCVKGPNLIVGRKRGSQRSSNVNVLCSECCRGNLCNNNGCHASGYQSPQNRGPICYNCPMALHPNSCSDIHICRRGDVCHFSTETNGLNDIRYLSKCEMKQTCYANVQRLQLGDPNAHSYSTGSTCLINCCETDLCNTGCNVTTTASTTSPTLTTLTTSATTVMRDHCNPDPCVNGQCTSHSGGFTCTCTAGFTGITCSTVMDLCQTNNPCQQGSCHANNGVVTCTCNPGYTGTHCDKVIDLCQTNNPCQQGSCHANNGVVTCTCNPGYSGTHCDKAKSHYHCYPNPCQHGSCANRVTGFYCTCREGYTGQRCDQHDHVTDHCNPNPCQHGSCSNTGSSFTCTCQAGYTGYHCERGMCSSGWSFYNNHCYYFDQEAGKTFDQSVVLCFHKKSRLVHVDDSGEAAFIKGKLAHLKSTHYWIGITDKDREGEWRYYDTHQVIHFTDWAPGEPDDYTKGMRESCAVFSPFFGDNFRWADLECGRTDAQAICEVPI